MCGITGIVSTTNIAPQLFDGMKSLEYRGYDSAGMAMLCDGHLEVRKDVGKIADVEGRQALSTMVGQVGIAHTRWATHGGVTQDNSHPHVSSDGCFAIVHNGIIENYASLKAELLAHGYAFRSQTDSEVIVHLIAFYHAHGLSVEDALVAATARLEGAYAFALLSTHTPDRLYCARQESPLVIGVSAEALYLASDLNAFGSYTQQAVYLNDGEYAILRADGHCIKTLSTQEDIVRPPTEISWYRGHVSEKGPYPHYMLKEIHEGADCIETALAIPEASIRALAEQIAARPQTLLTGVGTAYYVALIAQYYLANLADVYIPVISADEFPTLGKLQRGGMTLAISQSGETYDTLKALRHTKAAGGLTAAVVNVPGSSIAREVDQVILQEAGPEICVLSTKSTISQISILLRVALDLAWLRRGLETADYQQHLLTLKDLPLTLRDMYTELLPQVRRVAERYCQTKNWFFIGRGIYSPVALESALKFKEVSYLHAEGMPGGFLKHGTIALIDTDTHSVAFLPPQEESALLNATLANVQEIRAYGFFQCKGKDCKQDTGKDQ